MHSQASSFLCSILYIRSTPFWENEHRFRFVMHGVSMFSRCLLMSPRSLEGDSLRGDPCDPHFFELNEECGTLRADQLPIAMGFCQILMSVHRKSIIVCMQRVLSLPPSAIASVTLCNGSCRRDVWRTWSNRLWHLTILRAGTLSGPVSFD